MPCCCEHGQQHAPPHRRRRPLRTLLKWLVLGVVVAEWWGRGGREFLFGERDETLGVGDSIKTWIDLTPLTPLPEVGVPGPVMKDGERIGWIFESRQKEGALDPAGREWEQYEVLVEVERAMVGYPITAALAEVEQLVRSTLYSS